MKIFVEAGGAVNNRMQQRRLNVAVAALILLHSWLASCSEQLCTLQSIGSIELTEQNIIHLTARLNSGAAGPMVTQLPNGPAEVGPYQQFWLKYLIVSAAIFGEVEECVLKTIYGLAGRKMFEHLSELLDRLARKNDCSTVVKFITMNLELREEANLVRHLVIELMERNWSAVRTLILKVLDALKGSARHSGMYCFVLRRLSIEQQYEIATDAGMPLPLVGDIYANCRLDPQLRELLASELHLEGRDVQLHRLANRSYSCMQFLDSRATGLEVPCPDSLPELSADVWRHIFGLLDMESLFTLPLVCSFWNESYLMILTRDARIHDLYLKELFGVEVFNVHTVAPWKYFLRSQEAALEYVGRCIANGGLCRIKTSLFLEFMAKRYLKAITEGQIRPPKIGQCASSYGSFLKLFEDVHEFCKHSKPDLDMPVFLTEGEYDSAVYYFVHGKGWILKLSDSLAVDDMPRLFRAIKEDAELMRLLITKHFSSPVVPSMILIMHGQAHELQAKLAKLVFSQVELLKDLAGPYLVRTGEYYHFLIEHDVLPKLIVEYFWVAHLYKLIISIVLFFKNDSNRIDRFVAATIDKLSDLSDWAQAQIVLEAERESSRILDDTDQHPPEDTEFFWSTMMRCGLLKEVRAQPIACAHY